MAISMAMSETDKFMDKFDPINSNRELRKKMRSQQGSGGNGSGNNSKRLNDPKKAGVMFDEKGNLLNDGADVCDCLRDSCPGCFFPCPKCRSPKCAHECRIHRRWIFESVEVEGSDTNVKNVHLPAKYCYLYYFIDAPCG